MMTQIKSHINYQKEWLFTEVPIYWAHMIRTLAPGANYSLSER